MTWIPRPADDETLKRRSRLARAVGDDLAAVGLPVVPEDADPSVTAGARVYVDRLDDESGGGVFVTWKAHFTLSSAAMDAVSEGRSADDPSIMLSGTASRAMQGAMAEILTVAGYDVREDANDMAPFQLQVLAWRPSPSWRDRLHAQTARRQEVSLATARERESRNGRDTADG